DSGNKLAIAGNFNAEENRKYLLHFNPGPVLNNTKWTITPNNAITFKDSGIYVKYFEFTNAKEAIVVQSLGQDEHAPLKIVFKDFELLTISQVAEQDTAILRGHMNGNLELRNLQGSPAFVSDLKITNMVYLQNPVGDLTVKADNISETGAN